jgi:hypothetical protein
MYETLFWFQTTQYKAIFILLLEYKHQALGQSSNEQESDCCSQATHVVKYCIDILNIRDFAIFNKKLIT